MKTSWQKQMTYHRAGSRSTVEKGVRIERRYARDWR